MRDSCCDCKYCKIVPIDSVFARFYCKKLPFQKDGVTGGIDIHISVDDGTVFRPRIINKEGGEK